METVLDFIDTDEVNEEGLGIILGTDFIQEINLLNLKEDN